LIGQDGLLGKGSAQHPYHSKTRLKRDYGNLEKSSPSAIAPQAPKSRGKPCPAALALASLATGQKSQHSAITGYGRHVVSGAAPEHPSDQNPPNRLALGVPQRTQRRHSGQELALKAAKTSTPSQPALPKARPEGAKRLWRAATGRPLKNLQENFNRTGKTEARKI